MLDGKPIVTIGILSQMAVVSGEEEVEALRSEVRKSPSL